MGIKGTKRRIAICIFWKFYQAGKFLVEKYGSLTAEQIANALGTTIAKAQKVVDLLNEIKALKAKIKTVIDELTAETTED